MRQASLLASIPWFLACTKDHSQPPVVVGLNALIDSTSSVRLRAPDDDLPEAPMGVMAKNGEILVLDRNRARVLAYDGRTGGFLRTVAGPGDGRGDLRAPAGFTWLADSTYAVLDRTRQVVWIRNASDSVTAEWPIPAGLTSLHKFGGALLVAGVTAVSPQDGIHEFSLAGAELATFGPSYATSSDWAGSLHGWFVAVSGKRIFSSSMRSAGVVLLDERGRKTGEWRLPPGVFRMPEWPPNRDLAKGLGPGGVGDKIAQWLRTQRLMNGLVADSVGNVLVRIQSLSGNGFQYEYALFNPLGRAVAFTGATPTYVGATGAGGLFWIDRRDHGFVVGLGYLRAGLAGAAGVTPDSSAHR
jgi:hypothetical protein